jgi:hypothetical protein
VKPEPCPLVPVHGAAGCVGHLRRTARSFVAGRPRYGNLMLRSAVARVPRSHMQD